MNAPIFVDTNVLIYVFDRADVQKQRAAAAWLSDLWKTRRARISLQVIQEFYVNLCRKDPSAVTNARTQARNLFAWGPVLPDSALVERAWQLQDHYQLSFWDSLIVAAAKSLSCAYLLTEDLQAGRDFDGLLVVNPFKTDPASVL
jgi:predicted nucleic acid-binding protein